MNSATAVASTSCSEANFSKASTSSGFTDTVIRSWLSETNISQGDNPGCLSGTLAKSILQPLVYSAISPIEEDSPPAPLSVMQLINPKSRASKIMSIIFFCVIGSPICTALDGDSSVNSSEEKVAP